MGTTYPPVFSIDNGKDFSWSYAPSSMGGSKIRCLTTYLIWNTGSHPRRSKRHLLENKNHTLWPTVGSYLLLFLAGRILKLASGFLENLGRMLFIHWQRDSNWLYRSHDGRSWFQHSVTAHVIPQSILTFQVLHQVAMENLQSFRQVESCKLYAAWHQSHTTVVAQSTSPSGCGDDGNV